MNLPELTKAIQRAVGAEVDGVFGQDTATLVWRALNDPDNETQEIPGGEDMDARTVNHLMTLDPKARESFGQFYRLANATAATYGCTYVIIGGNRTYEEQDALFAQGRTKPGEIVTRAKGGQSNHNFGIAADFGVFAGKTYLDDSNPVKASKVHKACSMHAAACGLEWGGSWKSLKDEPHYQIQTGLTMVQKRQRMAQKGSVL